MESIPKNHSMACLQLPFAFVHGKNMHVFISVLPVQLPESSKIGSVHYTLLVVSISCCLSLVSLGFPQDHQEMQLCSHGCSLHANMYARAENLVRYCLLF